MDINLSNVRKKSKNTEYLGCRVDPETKRWIEQFCEENDVTVSAIISELIKTFKENNDIK
jgi:hypothetical protein